LFWFWSLIRARFGYSSPVKKAINISFIIIHIIFILNTDYCGLVLAIHHLGLAEGW